MLKISFNVLDVLLGLGLVIVIILISGLIYWIWFVYWVSVDVYFVFVIKFLVWVDLFWLGLLFGLSEELLFWGVMFFVLGGGVLVVVVFSLVFGVLYFSSME